jgi:hypothetical protein
LLGPGFATENRALKRASARQGRGTGSILRAGTTDASAALGLLSPVTGTGDGGRVELEGGTSRVFRGARSFA